MVYSQQWQTLFPRHCESFYISPSDPSNIIIGFRNILLHTKNSGKEWEAIDSLGESVLIHQITPLNNSSRFILNANGPGWSGLYLIDTLKRTVQKTLHKTAKGTAVVMSSDSNTLYSVSYTKPVLSKSTDKGDTWYSIGAPLPSTYKENLYTCSITPVFTPAHMKLFVGCGTPPVIYMTEDTGRTWIKSFEYEGAHNARVPCIYPILNSPYLYACITESSNKAYIDGSVLRSIDYGKTWEILTSPNDIWAICTTESEIEPVIGQFRSIADSSGVSSVWFLESETQTWREARGLPAQLVWQLQYVPEISSLFAAADKGLFMLRLK